MKTTLKENMEKINVGSLLIKVFLIWFVIAFLIYPNFNIISQTFFREGRFTMDAVRRLSSSERALKSLINSFILAFSMVITVNIVGFFIAFVTEYFDIKGAKVLKLGYATTLIYGGIVLVSGYQFIYGSSGIVTQIISKFNPNLNPKWFVGYYAVLFIMTFACTSNHLIFLTNAIRGIDYQTIEAARNMGASSWKILYKIVLPVLKPTTFAITILTFLTGLGAVSAPLIVGGKDFQTINPMVIMFAKTTSSRDIAALLAMILGVATIVLLLVMNKIEKGGNYISVSKVKSRLVRQKIENPIVNIIVHIIAYLLFLVYIVPIMLIIVFSFTNARSISSGHFTWDSFTLNNYISLFTKATAFKPYLVSITYSLIAAVLVVIVCLAASRIIHKDKNKFSSFLEASLLIPWLIPSTLIALGLIMTYDKPSFIMGNQVLVGSVNMMLIAYIIVKIPFSLRMIKAAFFSVEDVLEESAKSMGASSFYTFRKIIFPIVMPSCLAVIALNFNSMLADYDLSVFLYHPLLQPLGIVIKDSTDIQANLESKTMTFVYSVILMIISSAMLYLVYRRAGRKK